MGLFQEELRPNIEKYLRVAMDRLTDKEREPGGRGLDLPVQPMDKMEGSDISTDNGDSDVEDCPTQSDHGSCL